MLILTASYTETSRFTHMEFTFDGPPGNPTFTFTGETFSEGLEEGAPFSISTTGVTSGNVVTVNYKIPATHFTATCEATGQVIPFEIDFKKYTGDLIFVNENNVAVTYLKGFQAIDRYNVIIKKVTGEIWNTLWKAGSGNPSGSSYYTGYISDLTRATRIPLDSGLSSTTNAQGHWEDLQDLQEFYVEINAWEPLQVKRFSDFLPKRQLKPAPPLQKKFEGYVNLQDLGIT